MKCDIKSYFPSINRNILLTLLEEINFSSDEMWFINKIVYEQSDINERGLPLGNESSQWFALLYLNKVDRLIKEKLQVKSYIRYMDDMILIHSDKDFLKECLRQIRCLCSKELQLQLNNKTQIGRVDNGIDFLGFNYTLTPTGKVLIKLRSSSKIRMKKHIRTLKKLKTNHYVDDDYILQRKNSFYNHVKIANGNHQIKQKLTNNANFP